MANGTKGGVGPSAESLKIAAQLSSLMSSMAASATKIDDAFASQAQATAKMAENMKQLSAGDLVGQLMEVNQTLKQVAGTLLQMKETGDTTFNALDSGALLVASSQEEMADAIETASNKMDDAKNPAKELRDALKKSGNESLSFRDKLKKIGNYLEKEFPYKTGFALGALSGLKQGFSNLMAGGKAVFGLAKTLVGAIFSIGKAIISIPFKLLDGLVSMAKKGMGQISELATALNNIRKQFGDLKGPIAGTIQTVARGMSGFGGPAFAIFGNVAERMELLNALFTEGGAALQSFTGEFKKNGGALLGYQRGLGISNEQMGALANNAKSTGRTLTTVLNNITKQSLALGKAFGIDAKLISRDMAKAAADVKHFGGMSEKQLGIAVTYARGLGLELDKVTGVLDAFTTFDEAAEKVSNLNQVFGTQVDAMTLVNSQNPADTIRHLREEFAKAGIDGAKLTRAQRAIIAQNTNLDDSQIQLALSAKNQGLEMKKIETAAERAERATLAQADAMNKLISQMERVLKAMEAKEGGFFGHFFAGFTDGLQRTGEFRELMMNIQKALMEVYHAGVKVGRAFVEYFPGVREFMDALADIFKPEKFRALMNDITGIITGFFKDLNTGQASFPELMNKLRAAFFDHFDKNTSAGGKLLDSFGKIMDAIKVIIAGAVSWIMSTLTDLGKSIIAFIKDPYGKNIGAGALSKVNGFISPIASAFRDGMKELGPVLSELGSLILDKLVKALLNAWDKYQWKIFWAMALPALGKGLLAVGTTALGKYAGEMLLKAFGGKAVQAAAAQAATQMATTIATEQAAATTAATAAQTATSPAVLAIGKFLTNPWVLAAAATAGTVIGIVKAWQGRTLSEAGRLQGEQFNRDLQEIMDDNVQTTDQKLKELTRQYGELEKKYYHEDEGIFESIATGLGMLARGGISAADEEALREKGLVEDAIEELKKRRKKEQLSLKKGTKEYTERLAKEREKQIQGSREEALKMVGPITMDTAEEVFKKLKAQGGKIKDAAVEAEKTLTDMRESFEKMDFRIFKTKEKQDEINAARVDAQNVYTIFENIVKALELIPKIPNLTQYLHPLESIGRNTQGTTMQKNRAEAEALANDSGIGVLSEYVKVIAEKFQTYDPEYMKKVATRFSVGGEIIRNMSGMFDDILTFLMKMRDPSGEFLNIQVMSGIIMEAINNMYALAKWMNLKAATEKIDFTGALDGVDNIADFLDALVSEKYEGKYRKSGEAPVFDRITQNMGYMARWAPTIEAQAKKIQDSFTALAGAISTIPDAAKAYPPVITAVYEMLDSIMQIDDALNKVQNVNLKAKLENIAGAQGLGGTTKIKTTVEASKPIEIHAHFTAVVDATKLEAALLESKGSQIKDRVNMLISMAQEISGESENLKVAKNNIKGAGRDALVGHPTSRTNIAPPAVTAAAKAT